MLKRGISDPWAALFEIAKSATPSKNELIPYWVFEGAEDDAGFSSVERHVPILPFSREVELYEYLNRTIALYRLAFGQPRQQDLISYLEELDPQKLKSAPSWQINLSPPE